MTTTKYTTLTLGDCLILMDEIDAALAVISNLKRPGTVEVGIKSMLTVIRREVAERILEIARARNVSGPSRFSSETV